MSRLPNGLQNGGAQWPFSFSKAALDESHCGIESVRQNLNRAAAETYLSPAHRCTGDTPSIACLVRYSRSPGNVIASCLYGTRIREMDVPLFMSTHRYKGHTIALVPSMEGLMWACQYVIMKADQTEIAGFPDGNTYDDRQKRNWPLLRKQNP